MTIKETLSKLDGLYAITEKDWILNVDLILTEQVCPIASIHPEGEKTNEFTCFGDTIEEAIEKSVEQVLKKYPGLNV